MGKFLNTHLGRFTEFSTPQKTAIKKDVKRLLNYNRPYTKNDLYDRLTDAVCEFYMKSEALITKPFDEQLER